MEIRTICGINKVYLSVYLSMDYANSFSFLLELLLSYSSHSSKMSRLTVYSVCAAVL